MKTDMKWLGTVRAVFLPVAAAALLANAAGCGRDEGNPQLYQSHCASCHGSDGEGLRSLYPPLEGSVYLSQRIDALPCLLVNGVASPFDSNSRPPKMRMPSFAGLDDDALYGLIVYLSATWGPGGKTLSRQDVRTWLGDCR